MELTLDELKWADVGTAFDRPYGMKKVANGGSLTTKEFNDAIFMPFDKQRPITILENTTITKIEYDAKLLINASGVTLTLNNGTAGNKLELIAVYDFSLVLGSEEAQTLTAGTYCVMYNGSQWLLDKASFFNKHNQDGSHKQSDIVPLSIPLENETEVILEETNTNGMASPAEVVIPTTGWYKIYLSGGKGGNGGKGGRGYKNGSYTSGSTGEDGTLGQNIKVNTLLKAGVYYYQLGGAGKNGGNGRDGDTLYVGEGGAAGAGFASGFVATAGYAGNKGVTANNNTAYRSGSGGGGGGSGGTSVFYNDDIMLLVYGGKGGKGGKGGNVSVNTSPTSSYTAEGGSGGNGGGTVLKDYLETNLLLQSTIKIERYIV